LLSLGVNGDQGVFPGMAESKNVQKAKQMSYTILMKMMHTAVNHPTILGWFIAGAGMHDIKNIQVRNLNN